MKKLIAVCALVFAIPMSARLGYNQQGDITVIAVLGCGDIDPLVGRLVAPPRCLFVTVATERKDVTLYLATVTFEDSTFKSRGITRDSKYATVVFPIEQSPVRSIDIEEFNADGVSVDWHSF